MRRGEPLRRTPMRRGRARLAPGPQRDWTSEALPKVRREGCCRVCMEGAQATKLEAAHIISRAKADEPHPDGDGRLIVRGVDVVPLCRRCHQEYDHHTLDLLPYLTPAEQVRAVQVAGGIMAALRRTTGRTWTPLQTPTPPEAA